MRVRAFCLLLALILAPALHASVSVTPMRLEILAEPGGAPEPFELVVANTSETRRTIRVRAEEFRLGLKGEMLFEERLREEQGDRYTPFELSAAPFISIADPVFPLDPGEQRRVRGTVRLPVTARGEYYASIAVNPGPADPVTSTTASRRVSVTFEVGVLAFVTAGVRRPSRFPDQPPTVIRAIEPYYDVRVVDWGVDFPKPTESRQTLKLVGKFANKGNTHILADVTATVRNLDERRIVEEVIIPAGSKVVFPNSEREFVATVQAPLRPGAYQAELRIGWGGALDVATRITQFEVRAPIAGVPTEMRRLGVLGLASERITLAGSAGRVVREDVTITNNVDEQLVVSVHPSEGLTAVPSRFLVTAGGERSFQVRAVLDSKALSDVSEKFVVLEPRRLDGTALPEPETRQLAVLLRVLPPGFQGRSPGE
ncbi:hypothetical protein FJZ36_09430 [Candidatus Poribacteria bacterium]|nr:hypothetical protein [Candidatus Poribacteria bacterium]